MDDIEAYLREVFRNGNLDRARLDACAILAHLRLAKALEKVARNTIPALDLPGPGDKSWRLNAPFTLDQVKSLNAFQRAHVFHPFTCGGSRTDAAHLDNEGVLLALPEGWVCLYCDYTQDWAHTFMTDWSWKNMIPSGIPPGVIG